MWRSVVKQIQTMVNFYRTLRNKFGAASEQKIPQCLFIRPIQVAILNQHTYVDMMIQLDTGFEGVGLITYEAIKDHLNLVDSIRFADTVLCTCLNGQDLISKGTIVLRWRGEGFRKVFRTKFHVIDGAFLPYQMLLGAPTIREHGILKLVGLGGLAVHPKKTKEETIADKARREEHRKKAAANDAKVAADKKAKADSEGNQNPRATGGRTGESSRG